MSLSLVVLAAGMGSRYGGLKQIDPVGPNGETILDYSIHDAVQAGFDRVVFIIRKDIETSFRDSVGGRFESRVDVAYAFQELTDLPAGFSVPADRQKPWGTAHAVLTVADAVHEPFAVINADDFYGASSYRRVAEFLSSTSSSSVPLEFAMVGFLLRNTVSQHGAVARGLCNVDESMCLRTVTEHSRIRIQDGALVSELEDGQLLQLAGDEWVSMNLWGFTPAVFPHLAESFEKFLQQQGQEMKSEFYIPSALDEMMSAHVARVRVLPSEDRWFGVTYREDKPVVEAAIAELVADGVYPSPL